MSDIALLTDKQVAELLSIHQITVWRWVREGKLPAPIKITSGATRWRRADIAAWLNAKKEAAA